MTPQDKSTVNSGLKIQALLFLRTAMVRSAAEPWQPYLSQLSSALFKAVGERYYKIAAEALRACEQLVRIIRPDLSQPISQQHLVGACKAIVLSGSALHFPELSLKEQISLIPATDIFNSFLPPDLSQCGSVNQSYHAKLLNYQIKTFMASCHFTGQQEMSNGRVQALAICNAHTLCNSAARPEPRHSLVTV